MSYADFADYDKDFPDYDIADYDIFENTPSTSIEAYDYATLANLLNYRGYKWLFKALTAIAVSNMRQRMSLPQRNYDDCPF